MGYKEKEQSYREYCASVPKQDRLRIALEMSAMAMKMNKHINIIIEKELKGHFVLEK